MNDLVLAADPKKTKVAVQYEDGTVKSAEILEAKVDGTMAVKYVSPDGRCWFCGTFCRDGVKVGTSWPILINAEETEEVEEVCYLNIYPDRKNIFDTEEKARKFALEDAVHVAVPTKTIYRIPKPSPPEPVVLEGIASVIELPHGYAEVSVKVDDKLARGISGRRCTLTIHE